MASTKADFSQNDPRWKNERLGFSTWETIGGFGCLVTSFANVAQAQGTDVNPKGMNQILRDRGQFVRDCYGEMADIAGYRALTTVVPRSRFIEQKNWPGSVVAPFEYFDVRKSTSIEVIIMLDYHPEAAGVQAHYCRVIGLNDAKNDIEIVDSWDGKRKWLSSIAGKGRKRPNQIIWTAGKYQKV